MNMDILVYALHEIRIHDAPSLTKTPCRLMPKAFSCGRLQMASAIYGMYIPTPTYNGINHRAIKEESHKRTRVRFPGNIELLAFELGKNGKNQNKHASGFRLLIGVGLEKNERCSRNPVNWALDTIVFISVTLEQDENHTHLSSISLVTFGIPV